MSEPEPPKMPLGRRMSRIGSLYQDERKMSRAFPFLHPAQTESSETAATRGRHNKPLFQPSYRLGPETTQYFNRGHAQKLMQQILESYLKSEPYNAKTAGNLTKTIVDLIKKRLREEALRSPRYKLVVFVTIGQNQSQAFTSASRCLWFKDHDDFAEASFSNSFIFAVATAFAVYHD